MRHKIVKYLCISLIALVFSCNFSQGNKEFKSEDLPLNKYYATEHFSIYQGKGYYLLEVSSLFQNFDGKERYVFYDKAQEKPQLTNITHYIQTPIQSLSISSTTHLGFLNALGQTQAIIAAKDMRFTYDQNFTKLLNEGAVVDLGGDTYDVETLLKLKEEVNIAYAIDGEGYREIQQLRKKGERFIMMAEFMETEPLEKTKWLLPMALLFGEESMQDALQIIENVEERYQTLIAKVDEIQNKPRIMIGLPWSGTWYVSGGNSFQAKFIEDAGGEYIWSEIEAKASVPISIEKVFKDALDADFWINPGNARSLKDIEDRDERFTVLSPLKNQKVFNQNRRYSPNNGNDYWESGVVHPDLILADLIAIFHPEILKNHQLYYYQKLQP